VDLRLSHGFFARPVGVPTDPREEQGARFGSEPRLLQVLGEVLLEPVVAGHGVLLAILLVQPHPQAAVLHVDILDPHGERGADKP
jgi:hypothetical protein